MATNHRLNQAPVALAVALALAAPMAQAATDCTVTAATDDGTGNTAGTLSWAIATANNGGTTIYANGHPGGGCIHNTITLQTDVTVTGVMKRLIDSDMTITSDPSTCTHNGRCNIDGGGTFRPLFVKSGSVTIRDLNLDNGLAQGGSSSYGGGGAGLGGALFVYGGYVTLQNVDMNGNLAHGGNVNPLNPYYGGGGMFGHGISGGGGLFGGTNGANGGYGGTGYYGGSGGTPSHYTGGFGGGGFGNVASAGTGGFGGGGGYGNKGNAGDGGFGGGGGYSYGRNSSNGGNGGFGGGGGLGITVGGTGGYGGGDGQGLQNGNGNAGGGGAGLGGAIFIKKGLLTLKAVQFNNNSAQGGTSNNNGKGLGGGLFVCTSNLDSDSSAAGANGGCSAVIDESQSCGVSFSGNTANAGNNDLFWNNGGSQTGTTGVTDSCALTGTGTALTSSTANSVVGQGVTLTATVTNAVNANNTPDGTVTFQDGGTAISACSNLPINNTTGVASCTTSALSQGSHAITARYNGNTLFQGSTSAPLTQTVYQDAYTAGNPQGSGSITVGLNGGGSGCHFNSSQFTQPANPPQGMVFPDGVFAFQATGCTQSSTVTLSFTYPNPLPAGTQYWKYGPTAGNATPHWYTIPATVNGNQLTVQITDGGTGDSDLKADGTITDPGGPAYAANGIPTLSGWAMALLGLLLGGLGFWRMGRRYD